MLLQIHLADSSDHFLSIDRPFVEMDVCRVSAGVHQDRSCRNTFVCITIWKDLLSRLIQIESALLIQDRAKRRRGHHFGHGREIKQMRW